MIYVYAIRMYFRDKQLATHILWPIIWSIGSFRSASLSRQGEHTPQRYTQAHAHSLQKKNPRI